MASLNSLEGADMATSESSLKCLLGKLERVLQKKQSTPGSFLPILEELNTLEKQKDPSFRCPAAFMEYPPASSRKLWGQYYDSYWKIGLNATPDNYGEFIKCAELIPDDGILSEMLFIQLISLLDKKPKEFEHGFADNLPFFLTDGKWNGNRTLLIVIRILVETAGTRLDNAIYFLRALINQRSDNERPAIVLAIVSQIVFALQGNMSDRGNEHDSSAIQEKNKTTLRTFYQSIIPDIEKLIKHIDLDLLSAFYGLDIAMDIAIIKDAIETGLIPHANGRLYAQALIVARLIDIELTDKQWSMLLQRSLLFEDCALSWNDRSYKSLGIYAGAVITLTEKPMEVWADAITAWNRLVYRAINGLEDQVKYESRLDAYFSAAACTIDGLLIGSRATIKGKKAADLAWEIWQRAWSDCVDALHSCFFPTAAFHMSQALFVYAVLNFLDKIDYTVMLNQLPWVMLRNRGSANSRTMALVNLAKNYQSTIIKERYDKVFASHRKIKTEMDEALRQFEIDERNRKAQANADAHYGLKSRYVKIR